MNRTSRVLLTSLILTTVAARQARTAPTAPAPANAAHGQAADTRPTLFVVSTAHLDTQWLWTIQDTIRDSIRSTMRDNFKLIARDKDYLFNFEGSFRYQLMREYDPADFERLVRYAHAGRWHASGSSVDAGDTNVPAPESLIRHVLLGNRFYRQVLGQECTDLFLPDCFGFSWVLPSVAHHCGLTSFSTQKLTWGSAAGVPFDVGAWEGPDGGSVVAELNPGAYVSTIREDLTRNADWLARARHVGETCGASVAYHYFGTGDRGGAPDTKSVSWLEKSLAGTGPLRVVAARSDDLARSLSPDQIARLPLWRSELLMTRHGTGAYSSCGFMKRFNRRNEQLAAAAEHVAVAADWLGSAPYPSERLRDAWTRFLWHHHHDDVTGTCTPLAYPFSCNDEVLAGKEFSQVLDESVGALASVMDTRAQGVPVVVYNPLGLGRQDVVEARVRLPEGAPPHVRVFGPDGTEVPSQEVAADGDERSILFLASMAGMGLEAFDVRPAPAPCTMETGLLVRGTALSNRHYALHVDEQGDLAAIRDTEAERDVLSAPARLQLFDDTSRSWPEWEVTWQDLQAGPREAFGAPARVRVVERGPVRVMLEVQRRLAGSFLTQRISLDAGGAAGVVVVDNMLDWRSHGSLMKASFPLAASAPQATYDLGLGTIRRGNDTSTLYEVPAQQWVDLTSPDGAAGTSILSDCKAGWDKPSDGELRLTLVHSPLQVEKDFGPQRFRYAFASHVGDWHAGEVPALAARFNAPLQAFQVPAHDGPAGRTFMLLTCSDPHVGVMALKRAEDSAEVVLRLVDMHGHGASDAWVRLFAPVLSAREVTGQETPKAGGLVALENGAVRTTLEPSSMRTLALTLALPSEGMNRARSATTPVPLPFDADVASMPGEARGGSFDGTGHALPAELLPATLEDGAITFVLGSGARGKHNALTCRGQSIPLPVTQARSLYLLAAADGPVTATFSLAGADGTRHDADVNVASFTGFVGQAPSIVRDGHLVGALRIAEAWRRPDHVAWIGTHRHDERGRDEAYVFTYLFRYRLDLPPGDGAAVLTLPSEPRIKLLAATLASDPADDAREASEVTDEVVTTRIEPAGGLSIEPVSVKVTCDSPGAALRCTTDLADPVLESRPCRDLTLSTDTTLRARAFFGTRPAGDIAMRTFTFGTPSPALPATQATAPGLTVERFKGQWDSLGPMEATQPISTGTVRAPSLTGRPSDVDFGLRFTGFLRVPKSGAWTFSLRSDDGSALWIDGQEVVDDDGLHGSREAFGSVALGAGLHAVRLEYFQRTGDIDLATSWEGPGVPRAEIPAAAWLHPRPTATGPRLPR